MVHGVWFWYCGTGIVLVLPRRRGTSGASARQSMKVVRSSKKDSPEIDVIYSFEGFPRALPLDHIGAMPSDYVIGVLDAPLVPRLVPQELASLS